MLNAEQVRNELGIIRQRTNRPLSVAFFCHRQPDFDAVRDAAWRKRLEPYYRELELDPAAGSGGPGRLPFDEATCEVVEEFRPSVVSFHFGLPEQRLLERVKATGARVISSATTVAEARHLPNSN